MLKELILNNFPQTKVDLIFGYGSRVIKQGGYNQSSDLIDIIISVDDPMQWHQENLARNQQHYSFIRYLPSSIDIIKKTQEQFGAKIYFNPYVRLGNYSLKYGVIKTSHLIDDLLDWKNLYIAGRLHKPVEFLVNTCDRNELLKNSLRINKESALRAAILQLPETFTALQLYKTIAGLSYKGDFRMIFGEDINKIDNIVSTQVDRFDQMYLPLLKIIPTLHWNESKKIYIQDLSSTSVLRHLRLLPKEVRRSICEIHSVTARTLESEALLKSAAYSINCDKLVARSLSTIVRRSSLTQSLKGLITAGLVKSLKYSQRKLYKSFVSRIKWS